jgi:hypothetical protein
MLDIHAFMQQLAQTRPVFHSEADFQHAFAWQLHQQFPQAQIRLEYPYEVNNHWIYLDLWCDLGQERLAVELKYKTRALTCQFGNEIFNLKGHSAQPTGRYNFLRDVVRLENIVWSDNHTHGLAIMLANDSAYWKVSSREASDSDLRIHEGRPLEGELKWAQDSAPSVQLRGNYTAHWYKYSDLAEGTWGQMRYLALNTLFTS